MPLTNVPGGVVKLNTGFPFPLIGLGTYKVTGQETVTAVVDAALKAGYRMFDTAKYYRNEPELGNALQVTLVLLFFLGLISSQLRCYAASWYLEIHLSSMFSPLPPPSFLVPPRLQSSRPTPSTRHCAYTRCKQR